MAAIQFTTLIRLPFARGDFIDPSQADWNASKDRALWKVISKSSKTSDLNWAELATRFQVPQTFLLQQAAWLYERHFEHVRSQMKKVGSTTAPNASSSGSSHTVVGGVSMQRGGSGGSRGIVGRAPSALSIRSREGVSRADSNSPAQPPLSRTPSTNTITQSRAQLQTNTRPRPPRSARPSMTGARPSPLIPPSTVTHSEVIEPDSPVTALSSSSSSSSSSDEGPVHRSQLFRRPPRFQKQRPRDLLSYAEDPDEEDNERSGDVSLPFAQMHGAPPGLDGFPFPSPGKAPQASHLRRGQSVSMKGKETARSEAQALDVSSSLASSASDARDARDARDAPKPSKSGPGPLSPKHRAELAKLSPRTRSDKEGSDGMPSMGSSFSDIDDASISQSALEDALLSNIHAGRMSTLSNLRSRYL